MTDQPEWFKSKNYAVQREWTGREWLDELVHVNNKLSGWEKNKEKWRNIIANIDNLEPAVITPPTVYRLYGDEPPAMRAVAVGINLDAPDAEILAALAEELQRLRSEEKHPTPVKKRGRRPIVPNDVFDSEQFNKWINHKIIQAADLLIWRSGLEAACKPSDAELANWLFLGYDQPAKTFSNSKAVLVGALNLIPALAAQVSGRANPII